MDNLQTSASAPILPAADASRNIDLHSRSSVTYSYYPSAQSATPYEVCESFYDFAYRCGRTPRITAKDNGAAFSPFTYKDVGNGRLAAIGCSFFSFTFEKIRAFPTAGHDILECIDGLASFVYNTRIDSYHAHRGGNYQLVVALRTPIPAQHYRQVAMRFALRFSRLDAGINSSYMLTDPRVAFPSCTSERRQNWFRLHTQCGCGYDWVPDLADAQALSALSRGAH